MRNLIWIYVAAAVSLGAQVVEGLPGSFSYQRAASERDRERERDRDYQRGQKALDKRNWDEALQAFSAVSARKGERADGALYWQAYALNKLGRRDAALSALDQLAKQYPASRWLDDAKALGLEVRQASGQNVSPEGEPDEETKLMALNGLISADPERAMPFLEKMLKGGASPRLKERAMFVLAQSNSPKARDLLAQIAKGGSNPDLQLKAINYLGVVYGGGANRQLLGDIYASSNDLAVKRAILKAFMIGGDRERLFQAARSEKNADLRGFAINQLAISGGADQLWQLYQTESTPEIKEKILKSMFLTGKADRLMEIARSDKDAKMRAAAIHSLGLMGHKGSDVAGLYATESDPEVKKGIINALFIQGNAKALVDLARKTTDPALKRDIVGRLANMHSKEATDYMMEILK